MSMTLASGIQLKLLRNCPFAYEKYHVKETKFQTCAKNTLKNRAMTGQEGNVLLKATILQKTRDLSLLKKERGIRNSDDKLKYGEGLKILINTGSAANIAYLV